MLISLLLAPLALAEPEFRVETLSWGGHDRTARVHVATSAPARGLLPIVLAFHGGGGTALGFEKIARLSEVADREGFTLVYPEGLDHSWDDGREEKKNAADDVGFTRALIALLSKKYRADPARVFATGMSNGGLFSFRLACELSGQIAAAAPVVANLGTQLSRSCKPGRTIPILNIVGTKDPLMHFEGGQITGPFGFKKRGAILSSDATAQFWAGIMKCKPIPAITERADQAKDGTTVREETYSDCEKGARFKRVVVAGAGHGWPGGTPYLSVYLIGKTSKNWDASTEIWKFFQTTAPAAATRN